MKSLAELTRTVRPLVRSASEVDHLGRERLGVRSWVERPADVRVAHQTVSLSVQVLRLVRR
jgi:hypothetical protein